MQEERRALLPKYQAALRSALAQVIFPLLHSFRSS